MFRACKGLLNPEPTRHLLDSAPYLKQKRRLTSESEPLIDAIVVGAGVIGLAIARALALKGQEVIVLEAAGAIGTETSSRNSEVIHAGIYYPEGSLKAQLCMAGKKQLYDFCDRYGVPHLRLGKLLVATRADQLPALTALQATAAEAGVPLQWLSKEQVAEMEPEVRCEAALLSTTTGIVDSHSLMQELQRQLEDAGGTVALHTRLLGGSVAAAAAAGAAAWRGRQPLRVRVRDEGSGEEMELAARRLVNCAGLYAQDVARGLEGLPPHTIPQRSLAKGNYFSLAGRAPFHHLIYPLPEHGNAGLGTHLTLDLAGQAKFGPDVEWLPDALDPRHIDYTVDPKRSERFYPAIRSYWPGLPDGSLQPAYSGVRPKVVGPGKAAGDFIFQGIAQHGVPGLCNLYGIESPGLTASLAIADKLTNLLE
ncbi:hypothetical protein N2152v2_004726 [Parachlorella kessleri]